MTPCNDCKLPMSEEFTCACATPDVPHQATEYRDGLDGPGIEVPCECGNYGHRGLCCDCYSESCGMPSEDRRRARGEP